MLGGTGNLTVTTGGTWSGGNVSGANASLTIGMALSFVVDGRGGGKVHQRRDGEQQGNDNLTGTGNLGINNGATLNNSGMLDIQTDADIVTNTGTGTFVKYRYAAQIRRRGRHHDRQPASRSPKRHVRRADRHARIRVGQQHLQQRHAVHGPGSQLVTGNSTFNGTITSGGLTLQSGTFGGNASFAGTTAWTGGTMTGAFTVPAGATLNLDRSRRGRPHGRRRHRRAHDERDDERRAARRTRR